MEDFLVLAGAEFIAMVGFWPRLAGRSEGWHNEALLEDNPHLRVCLRAKQWATPVAFLLCVLAGMFAVRSFTTDFSEVIFLNLAVLLASVLVGYTISEIIVDRYRVGRSHSRRLTSAA